MPSQVFLRHTFITSDWIAEEAVHKIKTFNLNELDNHTSQLQKSTRKAMQVVPAHLWLSSGKVRKMECRVFH